ncbi:hypothetical protein [Roseateles oligotrophus]|uniref:SPOR domain-containing protein n=1 Tax=Roseateles oligotrophus TaxID=1769250 RepID=A0ABT2YJY0_9BURK|nr:hypothetical protein [Roseateles oligotrophus]MCV2370371.1 hypothetical protein [Roseateles oligotrophus]
MLRALVLLLLLLNAAFFGWTQGWLDPLVGIKASGDREPERIAQQLHPERVTLLSPQAAAALQTRSCLELGPLNGDTALAEAQAVLQRAGFTASDWQAQSSEQAGVWAVATIRLPSKDFQARKEETYKKMKIGFEYLSGPPEELPTMVLSRHASDKAAAAALEALTQRSLKGLRVMQLQAPLQRHSLRVPKADSAQTAKLMGLAKEPALHGGFRACAAQPAEAAASAAAAASSASAP